jgi:hypothetical protein
MPAAFRVAGTEVAFHTDGVPGSWISSVAPTGSD